MEVWQWFIGLPFIKPILEWIHSHGVKMLKSIYELREQRAKAIKTEIEAKEANIRFANLNKQQSIESRAREIKDEVFNDIETRHKTIFSIHTEMTVTVSSLKSNYNYEEDELVLEQVLEILYKEGKLSYEQNKNQFIHSL